MLKIILIALVVVLFINYSNKKTINAIKETRSSAFSSKDVTMKELYSKTTDFEKSELYFNHRLDMVIRKKYPNLITWKTVRKSRFDNLSKVILTESKAHHNPAEGVISDDNFTEQEASNVNTSTPPKPNSTGNSNGGTKDTKAKADSSATSTTTPANNGASEKKTSSNKDSAPKQQSNASSQAKSPAEEKPSPAIRYKDKEDKQMTVDSSTKICYDGTHYRLQVLDQEGKLQNVIITNDVAKALGNIFSDLRKACEITYEEKKRTHFNMLYKAGTYIDADVLFLTGIVPE